MKKSFAFFVFFALILSSCNLNASMNGQDGDSVATSVAATMIARSIEETVIANQNNVTATNTVMMVTATESATETPMPTATATEIQPTNTLIPTATKSVPCNVAGFVSDVTVPDGTEFAGGEAFTKTWRLKNMGTCAWTTSYKLVFSHGDQMNGVGEVALPMTVPTGQTVDVSINLKAPNAAGTYRGDYKLMDSSGNLFALSNGATFYVEIESTGAALLDPVAPATPKIFSPTDIVTANANGVSAPGAFILGDYSMNVGYNAFMRFDLSGVPDGATITSAKIEFPSFNVSGDPFGDLECVRAYIGNYFSISTGDVHFYATGAVARACSMAELENYILNANLINNHLAGNDILELNFQFNRHETDNDNADDRLTAVGASGARLILEYSVP